MTRFNGLSLAGRLMLVGSFKTSSTCSPLDKPGDNHKKQIIVS